MQPTAINPLFDRLTLGLVIIALAAPISYLEIAHPSLPSLDLSRATKVSQPATKTNTHTATAPQAQPAATPAKTATTSSYVHLRAGKSTTSAVITDIDAGTAVTLGDDSDATWQSATYQGKKGYIYRSYLQY